jgi:hypothetical protein
LAFTRDIVLDHQKVKQSKIGKWIYSAMVAQTWRAAIARKCVALIFNVSKLQTGIRQGLATHHFGHFDGSTFMARSFKTLGKLPPSFKPLNISAGDYAGFP